VDTPPPPEPSSAPPTSGPAVVPGVVLSQDEVHRIANEVAIFLRENSTPSNPLASANLPVTPTQVIEWLHLRLLLKKIFIIIIIAIVTSYTISPIAQKETGSLGIVRAPSARLGGPFQS